MSSCYLALRLKNPEGLPEGLSARLDRALPFVPEARFSAARGGIQLWAFLRDEGLWPEPRWHEDTSGAAVITGYGVADDRRLLGAADVLREPDAPALRRRFHGEWSMCKLTDEGLFVACDPVGTEHVYMTEQPGFFAVSNRARLLWELMKALGPRPAPDFEALGGLISPGYLVCTEGTAVRGVRLVDAHTAVVVPRDAGPVEIRALGGGEPAIPGAAPDWDTLAEHLRGNFAWIAGTNKPILAALTGGKDSRLVLAALKSAGLEKRASLYISVPPEHADHLAARRIADRFGLNLERKSPPPRTRILEDMRRHVALTEGALNAWDMTGAVTYHARLGLHGLFGELYRSRGAASPDPEAAARFWFSSPNLGGVLRPEALAPQITRTARWMKGELDRGTAPELLHEAYYARQYVPRWIGQARLGDGITALVLNLLYHPAIQRAFGGLPLADRTSDRVHFELMSRLWPELVELPFANASWKVDMVARSTNARAAITTEPVRHARPILGSGWQEPALVGQWRVIRERLEDASSLLEPLVVPARLRTFLDVAAVVLGVPQPVSSRARTALRSPLLLLHARSHKARILRIVLGLLTVVELEGELREAESAIVRVT
ncbi:hypothetical protein [Polyangium sorediatum]|uniref:Asparagine synthetase domain-containing protein n=1 Tax=Polyangium sorediatum TaxID=889274 RepID=A0ABT6P1S5_9BACT|nr:hypothetical protein [Polyangium sorediatum]MDI1434210.1 hypothetical protein [Polyangium sorediatum]